MVKMNKELKDFLRPYWYSYNRAIISLKQLLVKPLKFLPYSSIDIGPPKGFHKSTLDWIDSLDPEIKQKSSYREIYPPHEICRIAPKTLEGQTIHWKFTREYNHQFSTTFVAEIPQGRVIFEAGFIIATDDKILADVSVEHRRTIQGHTLFSLWKLPPVYQITGKAVMLSTKGSDVYFHWMFEVLPRLELLRCSGIDFNDIDTFIFSTYHLPFQLETLKILEIPQPKIVTNRDRYHIQAEELIVPSWTGIPGHMPHWACDFLRRSFLTNACGKSLEPSPRIYISRAQCRHRQVCNEARVTEVLEKLGFKTVILESMSVVEQALLFSGAEVVVAPHGAGLSNLVFCQPGTKVIEFFSPNYVETHYWALSNQMELDYYYLIGKGKKPPEYKDPHWIWDDISIEIELLLKLTNIAGIN